MHSSANFHAYIYEIYESRALKRGQRNIVQTADGFCRSSHNTNWHYRKQILDMKLIRFIPATRERGVRPCITLSVRPICNDIKMLSLGYWHERFRSTHTRRYQEYIRVDTKCISFVVSKIRISERGLARFCSDL